MELVLDLNGLGMGEDGGNGEDARNADVGGLSWAIRLVLALAAVGAAWFVMSDGWFGDIAAELLGRVHGSVIPGPLGTLLASLP